MEAPAPSVANNANAFFSHQALDTVINPSSNDAIPKVEVVAKSDPELTKTMQQLNKNIEKLPAGQQTVVTNNNSRTKSVNPSHLTDIPVAFNDHHLRLLALDND